MNPEEDPYLLSDIADWGIENFTPLILKARTDDFNEEIVLRLLAKCNYDKFVWAGIQTAYSFCHSDSAMDRIMGRILPPYYHKVEGIIRTKDYLYDRELGYDPTEEDHPTKQQSQAYLEQSKSDIQSVFATLQDMVMQHFCSVDILNNDTVENLTRKLEQKETELKKLFELIDGYRKIVEELQDIISDDDKTIKELDRKIERQQETIQKLKENAGSCEEDEPKAENLDNIIRLYQDQVSHLEEENQDLRLKVAQFEEDERKLNSKGVAKVVSFKGILNYIESNCSLDEAKTFEYMLLKLMSLGDADRNDYALLNAAMTKVRERETRNVNNYNAPITNNGTLNGDVKYNQDKNNEQ